MTFKIRGASSIPCRGKSFLFLLKMGRRPEWAYFRQGRQECDIWVPKRMQDVALLSVRGLGIVSKRVVENELYVT